MYREGSEEILLSTTTYEEDLEEPDPDLSEVHGHRDRKRGKNGFSHGEIPVKCKVKKF